MKLCWNANPKERPTSKDLYRLFYSWLNEPTKDIERQFEVAEEHRQKTTKYYDPIKAGKTNPGAIYRSRLLLTKPNSISQSRSSMYFTKI